MTELPDGPGWMHESTFYACFTRVSGQGHPKQFPSNQKGIDSNAKIDGLNGLQVEH